MRTVQQRIGASTADRGRRRFLAATLDRSQQPEGITSSNLDGVSVTYGYDKPNRLQTVTDTAAQPAVAQSVVLT